MEAGGATRLGYVKGQDSSGGDILGKYGPPLEREGGLQGHWVSRGVVEDVISCG